MVFNRNSFYRGRTLLYSSKIHKKDTDKYTEYYIKNYGVWNPVDWLEQNPFPGTIFGEATLIDVKKWQGKWIYQFVNYESLPEPIEVDKMYSHWWQYDLEKNQIIKFYPLSGDTIKQFYNLCEWIDRKGVVPENHPVRFLLEDDPRARKVRKGILRKINGRWRVVRLPSWKKIFVKRFGEEYLPIAKIDIDKRDSYA